MNSGSFWLADIGVDSLSVSLVTFEHSYQVNSIGPEIDYLSVDNNLTLAIDQSLSAVAEKSGIMPDDEPDTIALVISPDWVGYDGKIISAKLKVFEEMFRELKLRPMGFISYDEALAEANNHFEGYPSSFVLAHFFKSKLAVSLVYLGKVVERIERSVVPETFDSQILESILLELKTESTLPPQIIVTGKYSEAIIQSIKSHPWIGRKDVETFLHFPDIKAYDSQKLVDSYLDAVTSQFDNSQLTSPSSSPPPRTEPVPVLKLEEFVEDTVEDVSSISPDPSSEIVEVEPDAVGFGPIAENFTQVTPSTTDKILQEEFVEPMADQPLVIPPPIPAPKPKIKFNFPKIKFNRLSMPKWSNSIVLIPLVISPLLILIPFYFSKAEITLSLTPYTFKKSISATFDPSVTEVDIAKGVFPISSQSKELTTSVSTPATAQKTVGDRASGEITIFNKLDKAINLSKGTVLTSNSGLKFELETAVSVASSSSNLAAGVINLGQTKAAVKAMDIGQDYNLATDTILHIKDYLDTTAVAKVNNSLSGGNKRQVQAVGSSDKTTLDSKLTAEINATKEKYLADTVSNMSEVVSDLTQIKQGRVEYSREVGEEADTLTATVATTITTYMFDDNQKNKIISAIFSDNPDFANVKSNFKEFNLDITPTKSTALLPRGQATFSSSFLPKVDVPAIKKMISGKRQPTAFSLVKKNIPRVYNYQIVTNFKTFSFINPLPFRVENIIINIK